MCVYEVFTHNTFFRSSGTSTAFFNVSIVPWLLFSSIPSEIQRTGKIRSRRPLNLRNQEFNLRSFNHKENNNEPSACGISGDSFIAILI